MPECEEGCISGSDCSKCDDPFCQSCTNWVECDMCYPNARYIAGECICDHGYFYMDSVNSCIACHEACEICGNHLNTKCKRCRPGWYL
jgi:hypothetical protein